MPFLTGENVLQALDVGVVIHDANGAIRSANAAAGRILGLRQEQVVGIEAVDPRWRLVRPDGSPLPATEIPSEVTMRTGKPCSSVILGVERGTGERAWLSVSTDIITGPNGERAGVVATFTDVTQLHAAQLDLRNAHDRIRTITEAVPGIIFQGFVDTAGRSTFPFVAGGRVEEIFGVTADEIVKDARHVWSAMQEDDVAALRLAVERSARAQTPLDEVICIRRDRTSWLHIRSTPMPVSGGTLWTGVMTDITEQRMLADQLRDAQRRESMGVLAAGVAHNFNNMLAVIMPNIELAMSTPELASESLDDALAAARRAASLVKQLLYIGRGSARVPHQTVDLAAVLIDVAALAERTFDRRIVIEPAVTQSPAHVVGSPAHVHQVLLNLVLNARDAVKDGAQPRIRMKLDRMHGPLVGARASCDEHYVLVVEDNGIGMDEDTLLHAGEPFYTTKPPGGGTGLGLAMVIETVRDMGGTYEVSSTVDRGTRVTLRFPASAVVEAPMSRREPRGRLSRRRILIVDDEPMMRRVLRRSVERAEMVALEAEDGVAALALIEGMGANMNLDAVLLDLSMPNMSGVEVLRRLKTKHPALAVIVLSGDAGPQPGLELADATLQKPMTDNDVLKVLAATLNA